MIKILWNSDMLGSGREAKRDEFRKLIASFGRARTILCRCESEEAVTTGKSLGICFRAAISTACSASAHRASASCRIARRCDDPAAPLSGWRLGQKLGCEVEPLGRVEGFARTVLAAAGPSRLSKGDCLFPKDCVRSISYGAAPRREETNDAPTNGRRYRCGIW